MNKKMRTTLAPTSPIREPPSIFGELMIFVLTGIGFVLLAAPTLSRFPVRFVYNHSDSAPRGWYVVEAANRVRPGDLVVVRLRREAAVLAAERKYLPKGVPLLKSVAAIAPQHVCSDETGVRIDGELVASAMAADANGRPLAPWRGCRRLDGRELFLLSAHPRSFDSRYFGPVDAPQVLGRARPLLKGAES